MFLKLLSGLCLLFILLELLQIIIYVWNRCVGSIMC